MSQNHPYRSLKLPNDAPIELKPSPGKGWGAFATRRIERGATILVEKPLFVVRKPHQQITEKDVLTAFSRLQPHEKQQFSCLRYNGSDPFPLMTFALSENSFSLPYNGVLVEGLFLLHSRFNNSCIPNATLPINTTEIITSFAISDIMPGEEITFSYDGEASCRTRHERHISLRFVCHCKACLVGTAFQKASDMRRTFIRLLHYLNVGEDIPGYVQYPANTLIIDPDLRKRVKEARISLSAKLIYYLLTMVLLEEEGSLDDHTVKRFYPGIQALADCMSTYSNAVIAHMSLAQDTWQKKLIMAFKLYGRADASDRDAMNEIRKSRGLAPILN